MKLGLRPFEYMVIPFGRLTDMIFYHQYSLGLVDLTEYVEEQDSKYFPDLR